MSLKKSQRVLGAVLLVAGCCIGAGMLGLPLVTMTAGFLPTVVAFIISWAFMATTGLLLLEANLWFSQGVNLITLAEKTLGKTARTLVLFLFLFLFYCLMVAYLSGGGALISELAVQLFGIVLEPYYASIVMVALFGFVVFLGARDVDLVNRFLMAGLAVSYAVLMGLGIPHVKLSGMSEGVWKYAFPALPAMIISFGYHNLVPTLTTYLEGNVRHLRIAILAGSFIPLVIYLLWEGMILGILPKNGELQSAVDAGAMVTSLLRQTVGSSRVVEWMQAFAFFSLLTSFMPVGLSFVDFLADGLKMKKNNRGSLFLVSLVFLPPLIFSYFYPALFLTALNYAGAFGAVVLFGIIPVAMAWKGRYVEMRQGERLVPGGKPVLLLIAGFAGFVFLMQLINELGVLT